MRQRRSTAGAGILALLLVLCGCSVDDARGGGLVVIAPSEISEVVDKVGESPASVTGTLRLAENGCEIWEGEDDSDGAWILWPRATELADGDGGRILLEDGAVVAEGDALTGSGIFVPLSALPDGDDPDSYFGMHGGFCEAHRRGVMVLAEIALGR